MHRSGQLHYWLTVAVAALLIPACLISHLRIGVPAGLGLFLLGWVVQSIVWAAMLYQLAIPGSWEPVRHNRWRVVPALFMTGILVFVFGLKAGVLVAIAGLAGLEFYYRKGNWSAIAGALLPWAYLAFGIQLALYLSSVIVSLRPCTLYDTTFDRFDALLLFGHTVPSLSRAVTPLYVPAEIVYYSIGGVMGAAILFLCLSGDRPAAFQMCGAIVTAYYISLVVFLILPAQGPFTAAGLPPQLFTARVQRASLANALALYHHAGWMTPPMGYYVAFPSLHMAQPLIAAWFLRKWDRVSIIVFGYCILLAPAIVILQWHYVVDIIGGLAVAALAVWLVARAPVMATDRALPKAGEAGDVIAQEKWKPWGTLVGSPKP